MVGPGVRLIVAEVRHHARQLWWILAVTVISVSGMVLTPLLTRGALNDAVVQRVDRVTWCALGIVALAAVDFAGDYVRRWFAGKLSLDVQHRLRVRMYAAAQNSSAAQSGLLSPHEIVTRTNSDLQQIQLVLTMIPVPVAVAVYYTLGLGLMLWLSVPLTLIVVLTVVVFGCVVARVRIVVTDVAGQVQDLVSVFGQLVAELVSAHTLIVSEGLQHRGLAAVKEVTSRLYQARMSLARTQAPLSAALQVIPWCGQLAVVGVGALLVIRGSVDVGALVAFSLYLGMLVGPTRVLAMYVINLSRAVPSMNRVAAVLAAPAVDVSAGRPAPQGADMELALTKQQPPIRVRPGAVLVVDCPSSAQVEHVCALLARSEQASQCPGSVRLGGCAVEDLSLESYWREVVTVGRAPFFATGSIAQALCDGQEWDAARGQAALRVAGLDALIAQLPGGTDYELTEGAENLSGGQRARLAVARAWYSQAPWLVLQEPAAAVDPVTAAEVFGRLGRAVGASQSSRGVIVVTTDAAAVARAIPEAVLVEAPVQDAQPAADAQARTPQLSSVWDGPGAQVVTEEQALRVRTLVARSGWRFVCAALLMLITTGLTVGFSRVYDHVLTSASPPQDAAYPTRWLLLAVAIVVAWAIIDCVQAIVCATAAETVQRQVRRLAAQQVVLTPVGIARSTRRGEVLTKVVADVESLARFLQQGLAPALSALITIVVVAVSMLVIAPGVTSVALTNVVIVVGATVVFNVVLDRSYTRARRHMGQVNAALDEDTRGRDHVMRSGQARQAGNRFAALSDTYARARLRAQKAMAFYFPFVAFNAQVTTALVVWLCAREIAAGQLGVGVCAALLLLAGQLFGPVQQVASIIDGWKQATVAALKLNEFFAQPREPLDQATVEPAPRPRHPGELSVDQVSWGYAADAPVVRNVSLRVPAGQVLGIVGQSGAGKTTLIRLCAGLEHPQQGRIIAEGWCESRAHRDAYRRRVSYLPQEPILLSASIRTTITASDLTGGGAAATPIDAARLDYAVRAAGLTNTVSVLPGGLDYVVGAQASELPDQDRQRVSIARVLYSQAPIVVLDEPSAAMTDAEQRSLIAAVREQGRTCVVVTHQPATAAACDQVAVLEAGQLACVGDPAHLQQQGGNAFARWWAAGSRQYPEATGAD
nr:ABC transporter ATP-binding protein [Corynebacterium sp. c6VSa_13]